MKKKLSNIGYVVFILITTWIGACNIIQAFKCPKLTKTELFLLLPKTTILQFERCEKTN